MLLQIGQRDVFLLRQGVRRTGNDHDRIVHEGMTSQAHRLRNQPHDDQIVSIALQTSNDLTAIDDFQLQLDGRVEFVKRAQQMRGEIFRTGDRGKPEFALHAALYGAQAHIHTFYIFKKFAAEALEFLPCRRQKKFFPDFFQQRHVQTRLVSSCLI